MATKRHTEKTLGEIEAAVGTLITRFHRDLLGRGPRHVTVTLRGHTLFVHLEGVLTTAEERLLMLSSPPSVGAAMVRQMRDHIMQGVRVRLLTELHGTLGRIVGGMLHDVAPEFDQEMFVFSLPTETSAA